MASLVNTITQIADVFYGVNILEQTPVAAIQGVTTSVVGSVADLPWGPVDTVVSIGSAAELFETFAPVDFDQQVLAVSHPALLAYINKPFPAILKIVRIAATGQAVATETFADGAAGASVDVSARHPSDIGNRITIEWTVNADDADARDATVAITGSAYSVTYPAVASALTTVTDPGDPYAAFVANVAMADVPVVAAAAPLAAGSDGTPVVGDYLGVIGTGGGLEEYTDVSVDVDVLFGAEIPQALVATWNAGFLAWFVANKRAFGSLSTDSSINTTAASITDVASFRDDRFQYPWPRVTTVNTFDPERGTVTVDGNAFAAVAIASVPPEVSPGGAPGAPFLRGITGTEFPGGSAATRKAQNAAGVAPWFNSTALEGFIIHRGLTTSQASGKTKIFRRRMTDFIMDSIAAASEQFVGTLLDLDLPNKGFGSNTAVQKGRWQEFLENLVTDERIRSFGIDAFSANTQTNIDAGQWRVIISVKLFSAQEELIFLADIGEFVEVTTIA